MALHMLQLLTLRKNRRELNKPSTGGSDLNKASASLRKLQSPLPLHRACEIPASCLIEIFVISQQRSLKVLSEWRRDNDMHYAALTAYRQLSALVPFPKRSLLRRSSILVDKSAALEEGHHHVDKFIFTDDCLVAQNHHGFIWRDINTRKKVKEVTDVALGGTYNTYYISTNARYIAWYQPRTNTSSDLYCYDLEKSSRQKLENVPISLYDQILAIVPSAQGTHVITQNRTPSREVRINTWNMNRQERVASFNCGYSKSLLFVDDTTKICARLTPISDDADLKTQYALNVWNVQTGKNLCHHELDSACHKLHSSLNGTMIAVERYKDDRVSFFKKDEVPSTLHEMWCIALLKRLVLFQHRFKYYSKHYAHYAKKYTRFC